MRASARSSTSCWCMASRCSRRRPRGAVAGFVSGGAASGHHFALVVQGHRHRAPVRPAGGAAHRARHRLLRRRRRRSQAANSGRAARSHDRDRARQPRSGRTAVPPCRAAAARIDRYFRARPRRAGRGQPRHGPGAVRRRDRLSAGKFSRHRPQSHRRRTHHVRAGELRALPPQDFQCVLGHRRQGRGAHAVRHDPRDGESQSAGHGARLFGQLRHHGRARDRALLPRCGRPLRLSPRDHAHPDEGGDAQPSDRDFAVSGRGHGLGRRDPRRRARPAAEPSPKPASRVFRCRICAFPAASSLGKRSTASPVASPLRWTSCSKARSAPRRSTTSSAAPILRVTSAASRSRPTASCAAITSRS